MLRIRPSLTWLPVIRIEGRATVVVASIVWLDRGGRDVAQQGKALHRLFSC
jgi:hypothetical protein